MKNIIKFASIALLALSITACNEEEDLKFNPDTSTGMQQDTQKFTDSPRSVTLEQFNRISVGMSSSEVIGILGVPTEKTTMTFQGNENVRYDWRNSMETGGFVFIIFQDDKVSQINQIGLR